MSDNTNIVIVNAAAVVRGIMADQGTDTDFNLKRDKILNIEIPRAKKPAILHSLCELTQNQGFDDLPEYPTIGDFAKVLAQHLPAKTLEQLADVAAKPFQQRRQASEERATSFRDMFPTKQTKERYFLNEASAL